MQRDSGTAALLCNSACVSLDAKAAAECQEGSKPGSQRTEPAALTIQPAVVQVAQNSWLGAAWQVAQPLAASVLQSTAGGGATHCTKMRG